MSPSHAHLSPEEDATSSAPPAGPQTLSNHVSNGLPQPFRRPAAARRCARACAVRVPANPYGERRSEARYGRLQDERAVFCGGPLPQAGGGGGGSQGLPPPRRLARTKNEYMAPPESAVCNAERQLILGEYKPAPPQSRPLRKRKINPRRAGPNFPAPHPRRSLTQRHIGRLRGGEAGRGGKREGSSEKNT